MGKQNIVLVLMDTARIGAVSSVRQHTDTVFSNLATDGFEYAKAFATSPWSLPSHASIFTGTYASKHGAHAGYKHLSSDLVLLPEAFRDNGYETVAVSNNTWISEEFGFGRGFEQFRKTWQYVQSNVDFGRIARMEEGMDKLRALGSEVFNGNPIVNLANIIYGQFGRSYHDNGAKRTNEWLESWLDRRNKSEPFFLFVNYLEPHLEYRPPKEFTEQFLPPSVSYDEAMKIPQDAWQFIAGKVTLSEHDFEILRGLYHAEIAYLDYRIGELVDHLKTHDEWKNTTFVITGDHGENIGDYGLMDHQYCLYDSLLHVPLVLHGGSFSGNKTVDDLIQLTDLAPTLLDEVGIEASEFRKQTQGRSFHPDADTKSRDRVIAEYRAPQPSMEALEKRVGALPESVYKYDRSLRSVRTHKWKLICGSDGVVELYNIELDPTESKNVAEENKDVVAAFQTKLDDWLDSFTHAEHGGEVSMRDETHQRLEDLGYLQ